MPFHHLVPVGSAALCAVVLAFFWPGVAHFDTLMQYRQVLSGVYSDWHPPIMARLWSLFHALGWASQAPMFLVQTGMYWTGLCLLAAALARSGARIAAAAVLVLGLWPPILGWQAMVVKDAQMAAALLAATGLVASKRLSGKPLGPLTAVLLLVLLGYALLVRSNAAFAVAPLAVGLLATWSWPEWRARTLMIGAVALAALALSPAINRGPLGAQPSGAEASLAIFDIAGIAHRAGPQAVPLLTAETWRRLEAQRCHSSVLWDIFSIGLRCDFIQRGLVGRPSGEIFSAWTRAVRQHPGAYLRHRLEHWNASMRWFVPWHFPQAVPQAESVPNTLGLASPSPRVRSYDRFAGWLANSPLGAPILALAVALAVLALARPARSAAHAIAVPLALSAASMDLSLLVISVAGDWRYHLWSMIASWLSAILLLTEPVSRRGARVAAAAVALVAVTSLGARLMLPQVGDDYQALVR
jgi:hypothetical protein